jgi:hypothetical protein
MQPDVIIRSDEIVSVRTPKAMKLSTSCQEPEKIHHVGHPTDLAQFCPSEGGREPQRATASRAKHRTPGLTPKTRAEFDLHYRNRHRRRCERQNTPIDLPSSSQLCRNPFNSFFPEVLE